MDFKGKAKVGEGEMSRYKVCADLKDVRRQG